MQSMAANTGASRQARVSNLRELLESLQKARTPAEIWSATFSALNKLPERDEKVGFLYALASRINGNIPEAERKGKAGVAEAVSTIRACIDFAASPEDYALYYKHFELWKVGASKDKLPEKEFAEWRIITTAVLLKEFDQQGYGAAQSDEPFYDMAERAERIRQGMRRSG